MNITQSNFRLYKPINNCYGGNGYLMTHQSLENNQVIKFISDEESRKHSLKNIKRLLKRPPIINSGYPIEAFYMEDEFYGYIETFFENAYTFDKIITSHKFSHKERLKASIDVTRQLKQLHDYGFIFNDIATTNLLIDKSGGHLIDFDEVARGDSDMSCKHYFLKNNRKILKDSTELDKLYLAITNLSLIYKIDIENIIIEETEEVKNILALFKDNKEVYELLLSYLDSENTPYFDILEDILSDEEKVMVDSSKIRTRIYKL